MIQLNRFILQLLILLGMILFLTWSCQKEDPPTITTLPVIEITGNTAQSGGNITADGGVSISLRGVVWSTMESPTLGSNEGSTSDGTGDGQFVSNLTDLSPRTTYFVRAYAMNSEGPIYGEQKEFTTEVEPPQVTTMEIINVTPVSAISGGNVTHDGGVTVTARGVIWSTSENPDIANYEGITQDSSGLGKFTSKIAVLQTATNYYVRAYAINSKGVAYGQQLSFTAAKDETEVVEVTNPATGKTWMDRNLGALQSATSKYDTKAYGDYYQWGRVLDGHEKINSGVTSSISNSDTPNHSNFILSDSVSNYDWRSPQNDNLWQGVNGINNPCPSGYRLPTEAEWEEERQSWSSDDAAGAMGSPLKLPRAGIRDYTTGYTIHEGTYGFYWTSTVTEKSVWFMRLSTNFISMRTSDHRAAGYSVRCIKD